MDLLNQNARTKLVTLRNRNNEDVHVRSMPFEFCTEDIIIERLQVQEVVFDEFLGIPIVVTSKLVNNCATPFRN